MRSVVVAFVVAVVWPAIAGAVFEPDLAMVCEPVPITSTSTVVPEKFTWRLYLGNGLTPADLGIRNNYVNELQKALLEPDYCGSHACEDGAKDKLIAAKEDLLVFWRAHDKPPKGDGFFVSPKLTENNRRAVFDAFLRNKVGAQALCVSKKAGPEEGGDQVVEVEVAPKKSLLDAVRIRKDPTGLTVAQRTSKGKINAAFKKVDPASFTAARDYLSHESTFNIDGVVGYAFGPHQFNKRSLAYAELIPYFRFTRQSVQNNDPDAADVRNVGGGAVANFHLEGLGGRFFEFAYYPEFTHSNRTQANIISQNFVLTPDLPLPGFGGRQALYMDAPVSVDAQLQMVGAFGNVTNDGNDPTLRDMHQFERLGPKMQVWLYGDDGILDGWSLTASYEILKALRGPLYAVRRFEAALSYTLPDTKFWTVDLKYANGRDLQTLEEQQQLTLGLGLRY